MKMGSIMASNVYTKNEILQTLASKGYFIDSYTLDTFFDKWQVEAIFEDEQGSEFYDKNALDLILSNLFSAKQEELKKEEEEKKEEVQPTPILAQPIQEQKPNPAIPTSQEAIDIVKKLDDELKIDSESAKILSDISLSDGTPLIDKVQDLSQDLPLESPSVNIIEPTVIEPLEEKKEEPKKLGILEGAMQATGLEFVKDEEPKPNEEIKTPEISETPEDSSDFDDISLLSESLEAQEKFREYVVSELSKKNVDLTPKNEFKLDISERTLNMIARTMAKKIAKHVSSICSQDAKSGAKLAEIEEEKKKLEKRARELEEQNKKLRLLLAESNRNLNSYKPSFFGLYKKVSPKN